jgi:two-component system, NtrC family, sensor histidine kinase PilS
MSVPALYAVNDLAWRVIGLLNLYRLLVPAVLLALYRLGDSPAFTPQHPQAFMLACGVYFLIGVVLITARRLAWFSLRQFILLNAALDTLALCFMLYASGGVASGLGILLVLPVGAGAVLASQRDAFFIAAFAAVGVLCQQLMTYFSDHTLGTDFTTAGVLGAVLFIVALAVWPVAHQLRETEATVRRQEVDLANLAQLSQYIVQHLRESILVVDSQDRIRLINESAAQILGDSQAFPGALLGEASPRLLYLLETWRNAAAQGLVHSREHTGTFVPQDGGREIQPHFAALGANAPTPVLVFLEDISLMTERVQQSKLAALGRLSASIAHEIRNPIGAMSHASQLLAESAQRSEEDLRLTQIIRSNADRVSVIIDNVLQLSKRSETRQETVSLAIWLQEFRQEFCSTMQLDSQCLDLDDTTNIDIEVRVDPSHLQQILWNLCENALRHGTVDTARIPIELRYGRLTSNARPFLSVADHGPGIAAEHLERIFEPFFSGGRGGTGLGLFLARELAQTNGATLLYEPRIGGGSIFRIVFSDPQRWQFG